MSVRPTESAERPHSFWVGCLQGGAVAACGVAAWILVGIGGLVAVVRRRPARLAVLGILVGAMVMLVATSVVKILVYDY